MENFGYLDREYWESSMRAPGIRDMNVIGIDWRKSGLCARRLVGRQGRFHAVSMLAEGEYVHKRNGRPPEQFFCGKLKALLSNIQEQPFAVQGGTEPEWNHEKGLCLLVSVPEARLERRQALDFAGRLEQMMRLLPRSGDGDAVCRGMPDQVKVVIFPRLRVVWEHCRGMRHDSSGIGVVQVLEESTQFLFRPGWEVTVSFGGRLAGSEDGLTRQYYQNPIRYRENNYLYEPDRFLWQDVSYASWYQAFYQICKKVFAAQSWEKECGHLAITGNEDCLPCARKALADMDVAADGSVPVKFNEIPSYLLQWFCRVHGLKWNEAASGTGKGFCDERFRQSGQTGYSGKSAEDIWDI